MKTRLINNFWPFVKYCIVGFSGTFFDLGILYFLVEFVNFPVLIATTCSFVIAVTNNFIWNKIWTFKNHSKNFRKLYIKFLIVSVIGLCITLSLMYIFVYLIEIWYLLAKILISVIVVFWNFMANKYWTFRITQNHLNLLSTYRYDLTIIIPCYNEENRINNTLLFIKNYLKKSSYNAEVLVVNDGSKDNTIKKVEMMQSDFRELRLISFEKNFGKGFAIKRGIKESKGEFILFTDADNSTPIEELDKLMRGLKEKNADIVIGSRYLKDSSVKIRQPLFRIWIGRIGNFLIRLFLIDNIIDTQCGFKLFKNRVAQEIFSLQKVKRYGFDMETLVIAKNLDFNIHEVAVNWFNSAESRVRPFRDAFITLKDLIYIKLNMWSGRYCIEDEEKTIN